jgi:hypothetical protein
VVIFHDRWSKLQHTINLFDERMDKRAVFSQRRGCPGEVTGTVLDGKKNDFLVAEQRMIGVDRNNVLQDPGLTTTPAR